MFTAYFDESGTDDRNYFTGIGGLIALAERWEHFGMRWRTILTEYDVPYSHMKDFAHSTGPFRKWKSACKEFEEQRQGFLGKLCDAAVEFSAHSFAFVVSKNIYDACVPEYMRKEMGSPYTFLARWCLVAISTWAQDNNYDEPINVIFERGQPQHALRVQHNILLARESSRKKFRIGELDFAEKYNKKDPERTVVALQGADLVAYETWKNETDRRFKTPFRMRNPMRRLQKIPHTWNALQAVDLIREVNVWKTVREYAVKIGAYPKR